MLKYIILFSVIALLFLVYLLSGVIKNYRSKDVEDVETIQSYIKKQKIRKVIFRIFIYIFLACIAVYIVFPFYWMIITSLKSTEELDSIYITYFPKEIIWENYPIAMARAKMGRLIFNTVYVGVISTLGTLVTTIFSAFAFARLKFIGRDLMFTLFLATMMIPGEMMVITNFITVSNFGWIDTYQAMIVPFLVSVFYIYLLRENFRQIPNELYLAAKVDGNGDLKYLFKILIPLSLPTITTITILKLMGSWNSYVWPNLVVQSAEMRLVSNGLRTSFTSEDGRSAQNLQMAAATVITAPLMLLFIFMRKYIMRGVSRSGIKG